VVGPSTWSLVAAELRRAGVAVAVPRLEEGGERGTPYWRRHRDAVAAQLAGSAPMVLVAHSGAGPLLPAIAERLGGRVGGYVFVDASIPEPGASRLELLAAELPEAAEQLRPLLARGGRFPTWSDEDLREEIPDHALRGRVLSELRPMPLPFWDEPIPVFQGWPRAPCAYVQLSPAYEVAAARARGAGWCFARLAGGHFHILVDPGAVARELLAVLPGDHGWRRG
jgi:pimeloyl-ACP methyl ester carboxylesterase